MVDPGLCVTVLKADQASPCSGHAPQPTVRVTVYVTSIIKVIYRRHMCWMEYFDGGIRSPPAFLHHPEN